MTSIHLTGVAFAPQIARAAQRHHLDPRLLAAIAAQETGGPGSNSGRNIVGDGGHGHGLFQIDDRYHAFAGTAAAMDPAMNADYAAGMLSDLLKQNGGDVHKALSAYNAGDPNAAGTVTQWQDGQQLGYADSVLRHYACEMQAEAPAPGSSFDSLLQLAGQQLPPPAAPQNDPHPWRATEADFGSLVDPLGGREGDASN